VDGVPLVQLVCPRCEKGFCLCRSCYRRHVYCSEKCAETARRLSVKAARKKHRQSEEGRLDHRDRERERRRRRKAEREACVGDHTSPAEKPSVTMSPVSLLPIHGVAQVQLRGRDDIAERRLVVLEATVPFVGSHTEFLSPKKQHRCAICGRAGYLVDGFPGSQTVMRR
jgi:hypothetical protein